MKKRNDRNNFVLGHSNGNVYFIQIIKFRVERFGKKKNVENGWTSNHGFKYLYTIQFGDILPKNEFIFIMAMVNE